MVNMQVRNDDIMADFDEAACLQLLKEAKLAKQNELKKRQKAQLIDIVRPRSASKFYAKVKSSSPKPNSTRVRRPRKVIQ